ncbi:MAG: 4Fe-4S binding protein [Candidatus Lokiarchaeota archaeon]|nr:4Fe-4S binding protein [Candidatus Harpocratesius repetitus]
MQIEMKFRYYDGDPGEFIKVIEDKCTGCGQCAKFCTTRVWEKVGKIYKPINLSNCVECGACWNVCMADAIDFGEPHGGTGVKFSYG